MGPRRQHRNSASHGDRLARRNRHPAGGLANPTGHRSAAADRRHHARHPSLHPARASNQQHRPRIRPGRTPDGQRQTLPQNRTLRRRSGADGGADIEDRRPDNTLAGLSRRRCGHPAHRRPEQSDLAGDLDRAKPSDSPNVRLSRTPRVKHTGRMTGRVTPRTWPTSARAAHLGARRSRRGPKWAGTEGLDNRRAEVVMPSDRPSSPGREPFVRSEAIGNL
jgi:hypothetical protein